MTKTSKLNPASCMGMKPGCRFSLKSSIKNGLKLVLSHSVLKRTNIVGLVFQKFPFPWCYHYYKYSITTSLATAKYHKPSRSHWDNNTDYSFQYEQDNNQAKYWWLTIQWLFRVADSDSVLIDLRLQKSRNMDSLTNPEKSQDKLKSLYYKAFTCK